MTKIAIGPRSRVRERNSRKVGSALSPLRKRSRNQAGRTAPTGRREAGAGSQLCHESVTYPWDSVSHLYKGGVQSLPGSLQGPQFSFMREQVWKSFPNCKAQCTHLG